MLLSMTGFGEASCRQDGVSIAVEMRTINSRYFKLTVRAPEGYAVLEPQVERLIHEQIKRGTVLVQYRVERPRKPEDFRVDERVLACYHQQLDAISRSWGSADNVPIGSLLLLPGVVQDLSTHGDLDATGDWPLLRKVLAEAIENLMRMRSTEGAAMAADLAANCHAVAEGLTRIEALAPRVVETYRQRLSERVQKALESLQVRVDPADLIREVSLFGERSDISEETVRLRAHLEQFQEIMERPESSGRKLDFLTQEMFRESNTIGAKANDAEIARHVVEVKAAIERIREQVQNIE